MSTVLVIHPGGLGDVILGVPALRALRAAYPTSALGLLAGEAIGDLLARCGEIDRVFSLEGTALTELLAGPDAMASDLREWLAAADLVVAWMNDPAGSLAETFAACGVKRAVIRSAHGHLMARLTPSNYHQTERLVQTLSMTCPMHRHPLSLPATLVTEGARLLSRLKVVPTHLVGIHPGSGSLHKCCTADLMGGVIDGIRAQGWTPLLIEGPADSIAVKAVLDVCSPPPVIASGLSLPSMAALLSHLQVFIGQDSGLSHLAALLGRPTVALFGPTDPRRWAPDGDHVAIVTGEPCHCETWQVVQGCRPKRCLAIPVHEVLAAALSLRSRAGQVHPPPASTCSGSTVMLQSRATFSLN